MYGFTPRPVSLNKPVKPINGLINYIDAYYIDWDLSNPKFIDGFRKFYPDWLNREGSVAEIIIIDLEEGIDRGDQPVELLNKLIKQTLRTRMPTFDQSEIEVDDDTEADDDS
jgi:hypothetical protein